MLRLGEFEPERCGCGRMNPPSAAWCSACGRALGAEPSFSARIDWQHDTAEVVDIRASDLNGEFPRLWRSGGAGAWYVTESPSGIAMAHVLDGGGFAAQPKPIRLGRFADIRAIEATRRGLYVAIGDRLAMALQPLHDPWQGASEPTVVAQERPVVAIASAPGGRLYRLTRSGDRLQLSVGSGIGAWQELASASVLGTRESWLDMAVSPSGDALFWGGGLAGTFDQRRRRLETRSFAIADVPFSLKERMGRLPVGDWRAWSPSQPVLVPLQEGGLGLLGCADASCTLRPLPESVPELQVAVSTEGAVVGRAGDSIVRLYLGQGPAATVVAGPADAASAMAGFPSGDGAVFIVSNGDGTRAEVLYEERVAAPGDAFILSRGDEMASGTGFEPIAICNYSAQSGLMHRIWVALDHSPGHRAGAIQRILRFGTSDG